MNTVNTNISALIAQKNMQEQNKDMDAAMQRLSSGLRINTAADDAAGSAIASTMEAQIKSLVLQLEIQTMQFYDMNR